jgi:hypothetical protein
VKWFNFILILFGFIQLILLAARQTQDTVDSKVRKKVRNRFAPDNNKIGLIFVDDLNMPIRQDSGAQPPIELLRQWMDHQVFNFYYFISNLNRKSNQKYSTIVLLLFFTYNQFYFFIRN